MTTEPIDPNTEWIPGTEYLLHFDVDYIASTGSMSVQNAVDNAMKKIAERPELVMQGYTFDPVARTLNVHVLAVQPGSPILAIVGVMLAIGLLFAISLVLKAAAKVLDTGAVTLPGGGKINLIGLGIGLLALGIGWAYIRKARA